MRCSQKKIKSFPCLTDNPRKMEISIQRVWLLLKKRWVDHQKMYWLGMLAMAGIMAVVFLMSTSPYFNRSGLEYRFQEIFFFQGLVFSGGIFSATLLSQFAEKPTGIQALMLPASALEKIMTAILYSNLLFPLVYGIFIYPVLLLAHFVDVQIQGNINILYDFQSQNIWGFITLCLLAQNFVLLCSVIFKRHVIIKTAIVGCMLFFGFYYLNDKLAATLVKDVQPTTTVSLSDEISTYLINTRKMKDPNKEMTQTSYLYVAAAPFNSIRFDIFDSVGVYVELPKRHAYLFNIIFHGSWVLLCWLATWFRLREKQV